MGSCCCKNTQIPTFSFNDCVKNIKCQSSCLSSCCVNGSKVKTSDNPNFNNSGHHHHRHSHHHKHKETEIYG
jgi:hypothetical protein